MQADDIAEQLLQLIIDREYHPGDRITEQEVADRFGISRGPTREALRMLAARSVLKIEKGKGASVVRMTDAEVRDTIEISAAIFGIVARRAAEAATKRDVACIERAVERLHCLLEENVTSREFYEGTREAGRALVNASHSTRLASELMHSRSGPPNIFGPLAYRTRAQKRRGARNWSAMVQAIAFRDAKKAEKLARTLYENASKAAFQAE